MASLENFVENNKGKLYLLLAILALIDRFLVLHYFGFRYTGNDDTVLWMGARDYMHGVFHEPFFYGQNYNYMAEALFAVPLLFFGIHVEYALPAVTSFMTLLPFFAFSYLSYKNKNFAGAFILIAIPLLLPVEYGMITSMSRGFINGIFFVSFIPLLMNANPSRFRFFLSGMCAAIAVAVNPNSLVVLVPLFVYYLCMNFRNLNFYVFLFCGIIPVVVLNYLALQFYVSNPGYKVHELSTWRLTFHSELIPECFAMLAKLFKYLMPVFWPGGGLVFYFLMLLCIILLFRKKYVYALSVAATAALIIYSFAFAKIQDGFDNLLLPYSRMFLAVPLLYGIFISWAVEKLRFTNIITMFIFLLSIFFFIKKSYHAHRKINRVITEQQNGFMLLYPVSALKKDCATFKLLAEKNNAQLIAGYDLDCSQPYLHTLFYGCSVLNDTFPLTILASPDKRTWRYYEEEKTIRENILFIGGNTDFWRKAAEKGFSVRKISENPFVCVLKNDNIKTIELFRRLEIPVRNY